MKTSIYTFLHEKWLEEDDDGISAVFISSHRQAILDAMVDVLGRDKLYDLELLERAYSDLMSEE